MPLVCRSCTRVNPAEARYCYHDGAPLDGHAHGSGPLAIGAQRFYNPFVFPSGKNARSFDELVLTCEANWSEAQEVLHQGYLEGFLAALGRADLARTARLAAKAPDADRGLEEFLSKLPASTRQPPRLIVQPLEINLGQLSRDRDQRVILDLANTGMGLLAGSISCVESNWLSVGEGAASTRKLFQLRNELSLPIRVVGKFLRAGQKKLEGRLNIETNGGGATVLVRAEVPVVPFPDGVLAGAHSPREIASKAKAAPKDAAPLFETGAVARWYERNGWTYPVGEPPASGLGAIQQFFEALGLVTPPKVEISTQTVSLAGAVGASLTEEIQVQTVEKRPVFAHATSSVPWLKISKVALEGRIARIALTVPSVPSQPGECLQGIVHITTNGNQRFSVDVTLNIAGLSGAHLLAGGWGRTPARQTMPSLDLEIASAVPVLAVAAAEDLLAPIEVPFHDAASSSRKPGRDTRRSSPTAAVSQVPSVADLYGTSAPVARVVPLPDQREEPVMVVPVDLTAPPPPRRRRPGPVVQNKKEPGEVNADDGEPTGPRQAPFWMHLLPLGFLLLCLLATLIRDLLHQAAYPVDLDPQPRITLRFHDQEMRIGLGTGGVKPGEAGGGGKTRPAIWEPSMRFGLLMLNQPDPLRPGKLKRLTFEEQGLTNNTVVKLDGNEWIFGDRPFREMDGTYKEDWPGRWLGKHDEPMAQNPYSIEGRRSVWSYDGQKVEITQMVEIVRGTQSNLLDTCLVRYRIQNNDQVPHNVGLRFLLDTFIGSNDGVPFLIPGSSTLCNTQMVFTDPNKIPDFIQACEKSDLSNPGTIAQVGLHVSNKLESPTRVTLGAWPNPLLETLDIRCQQEKTKWEVPVLNIKTLPPGDSAVTLYWDPIQLGPNQFREVGFSYGLGNVSAGEGSGKLALTVGGSFIPRGEFTVTAYVSNPIPGQTVTLKLPDGFDLIEAQLTQPVPLLRDASTRNSPVTWKVRGPRQEGKYTLKVDSSTGVSQTQPVTIKLRGIFGG
jgi:hypothetical protein